MVEHIITLLKKHDYVIVPGLGGFITHHEPARRNMGSNTISPPSKKLAFNRSLKENDGLLVNHLTMTGISPAQAQQNIDLFIATVEESLQQTGAYLLSGIGKLFCLPSSKSSAP